MNLLFVIARAFCIGWMACEIADWVHVGFTGASVICLWLIVGCRIVDGALERVK